MNKEKIHTLIQESLGGRVLEYNLYEDNRNYGIELTLSSDSLNEKVKMDNISNDKEMVVELIDYLYENAVDTIHAKDVVEDYISSL